MEYYELLAKRRMYRHFSRQPVPDPVLKRILEAATRGPSAGFTQGFDFLVLNQRPALDKFWELAITEDWKEKTTSHQGLWNAPVVVLPLANPDAYLSRYSEKDKSYANLVTERDWPIPFWFIDTAFATMLMLNSVVNENLGALFFGLFRNVDLIKNAFRIPDTFHPIGAVAIGFPTSDTKSSSAKRPRREQSSQIHFNTFS
ncbi:MAG: nitroreductase family protein [Actinomycetota bacterium]|nr:MAG: nitroreductase family protein [Actinomycetota bacterium]